MIKARVPLLLALLVAGCASGGAERTGSAVGQAATTPLSDLNIVRADIPAVLAAAQKALDAALGPDLDTPATDANPSLIERSANDALRRTAEGVIPFRGWVRKLTGAERYSREVAAAIAAGTIRRAYLKGLGAAAGCAAPAAPRAP
jgi:hypothetical protein